MYDNAKTYHHLMYNVSSINLDLCRSMYMIMLRLKHEHKGSM